MVNHTDEKNCLHWSVVSSFLPIKKKKKYSCSVCRQEVFLLRARLEPFVIAQLRLSCLHSFISSFLGPFAKLRKATVSFVMSVRPSAWNNSAPTG